MDSIVKDQMVQLKRLYNFKPTGDYIDGSPIVNLAFGDWDETTNRIKDDSISNNGDKDRILATVAFTAVDYINKKGRFPIIVKGSCPRRTRLYQMALNVHRKDIDELFLIYGLIGRSWELFVSGRNYDMFLYPII